MFINNIPKKNGFTLLEVMISVAILAIGMLGIAGLNMISIEHNNAAYLRSQAVTITQDIVERMRNNVPAVNGGKFDDVKSSEIDVLPATSCLTHTDGCTSDQLADIDIAQWLQSIQTINSDNERQQLPGASATIKKDATTDNLFTVKVEWTVKRLEKVSGNYIRGESKSNYTFEVIIH